MNKVYKVIWNRTKQCYIVVSEFAKQAGKVKSNHLFAAMGKTTAAVGLGAALLFVPWGGMNAFAATGGQVIGGGGSDSGDTSQATGQDATISGGFVNHADGNYSSVSGGSKNHAKGTNSSVSGGTDNQAFGEGSSVSGGGQNKVTGKWASVAGGTQNQAGGDYSTVSGGSGNKAFGWGSIVIGGNGNVTGKVAVDDDGNCLTDANGNQYSAAQDIFRIGMDSVAIGGFSSSVQGNNSVGIAGGSTSANAVSGLAAGKQATVTVANGVAIGYESTASVINSSRTADKDGRIVSFGHQAGDVYYTVDPWNHTVTESKYDSAAYNRLVNVADGVDDHDVVVMEQLKNAKAKAVATAKNQIQVKGDEDNVHAEETTGKDGVQTTTIELQDHLEVGVHEVKDTDGKVTTEGVDGSMQFKGATAKEVNITGDTGITLSDNGKKAAALRQADGAGYLDLTGTTAGTKATVSVHTGAQNLAQEDQTRLTYTDRGNKAHEVATLEDGLIFAGDTGDNVSRILNGTLKIYGGADVNSLSDGTNIGVVASSDGLQLKLAKNLTDIESITGLTNKTWDGKTYVSGRVATEDQLFQIQGSITDSAKGGGFGLTADKANASGTADVKQNLGSTIGIHGGSNITTSVSDKGSAINISLNKDVDLGTDGSIKAGGVTINNKGIDAGNKNITNVKSGIVNHNDSDNSNAANIGDVKKLAGEAAQGAVDSLGTRDFTGDDGEKISRKLGESMKLSGGADTSKLTDKNIGVVKNADGTGLDIKLSSELKGLTSVTTGNSTLNNDGLTINNSEGKAGTTITNSGIKIAANGDNTHVVEISNSNVSMGGQQIHDVAAGTSATDAVNVGQLSMFANNVGSAINKLDNRVNRVGAGASALAALHPLDFDPDDKWDFAGGFGHYKNANAVAIGAYYRPNEDTMFSIGGSFGGGENMLNAGVSFKLGQGNHVSTSRTMMAKEIESLKAVVKEQNENLQENENLRAQVDKQDKEIAELKAMVQQLAARR